MLTEICSRERTQNAVGRYRGQTCLSSFIIKHFRLIISPLTSFIQEEVRSRTAVSINIRAFSPLADMLNNKKPTWHSKWGLLWLLPGAWAGQPAGESTSFCCHLQTALPGRRWIKVGVEQPETNGSWPAHPRVCNGFVWSFPFFSGIRETSWGVHWENIFAHLKCTADTPDESSAVSVAGLLSSAVP